MKEGNRPEAFGVFKPVGYVLASFRSESDMAQAAQALRDAGFDNDQQVAYTASEMVHQADLDIAKASPLASLGQELNLVKAHRELAEQGQCFLAVHAPSNEQTERVAEIMRESNATRAQKYGTLMIEELIEVGSDEGQVPESPALGLDAQTVSGREGDSDAKPRR